MGGPKEGAGVAKVKNDLRPAFHHEGGPWAYRQENAENRLFLYFALNCAHEQRGGRPPYLNGDGSSPDYGGSQRKTGPIQKRLRRQLMRIRR